MRRWMWWAGVLAAVALVAVGGVTAYRGYADSGGPKAAVRGYFAALARADAPTALGYGDVPPGPRDLLTSTALRTQQRLAPIRDVAIISSTRSGSHAEVGVRYRRGAATVTDTVALHQHGGSWRLDRVALRTALRVTPAADRATLLGAAVPTGPVLLFPGALPIRFDTGYLRVAPGHAALALGAAARTDVPVELTTAGRRAAETGLVAALRRCLAGMGPAACPVPGTRYVPGTLRGTIPAHPSVTYSLSTAAAGVVEVTGRVTVDAATYRRLTFANRAVPGRGTVALPVHARMYVVRPGTLSWTAP
jgi:hypothetical protein